MLEVDGRAAGSRRGAVAGNRRDVCAGGKLAELRRAGVNAFARDVGQDLVYIGERPAVIDLHAKQTEIFRLEYADI